MQELKLDQDGINAAAAEMELAGWTSVWRPGVIAVSELSCGVAIFARHGIGLVDADVETSQPHRLVGAYVDCPGMQRFMLHSVYGSQRLGMSGLNADLTADSLAAFKGRRLCGWAGGDWNFEPDDLLNSGLLTKADAKVAAPPAPHLQCWSWHQDY